MLVSCFFSLGFPHVLVLEVFVLFHESRGFMMLSWRVLIYFIIKLKVRK